MAALWNFTSLTPLSGNAHVDIWIFHCPHKACPLSVSSFCVLIRDANTGLWMHLAHELSLICSPHWNRWKVDEKWNREVSGVHCDATLGTTVPLGDQWERTQYFLLFTKNLMNGCFNTCSNNAELLLFTWAVHLEHGSNLCPLRKTKDQLFNFIVNRMRFKILGHNS